MLTLPGARHRTCDGVSRRDFLRAGALALGGVTLADALRLQSLGGTASNRPPKTAVIQIFCGGGPSHLDMYDMKPNAPVEVRGEFREINTSVPGVRISEHLPLQAAAMSRMAVVRSVAHETSAHLIASQLILTGHQPPRVTVDNIYPSLGSIVAKMRGPNRPGLPAYVAVPKKTVYGNAAYLGTAFNPFTPEEDPNKKDFRVRNLALAGGMTLERLGNRSELLGRFDRLRRDIDLAGDMRGIDTFSRNALEMLTSDEAAHAFDIELEDPKVRDAYGRTQIGQNCLLARRLVEAGVTYVTCLSGGGWDTHTQNFAELKNVTLPRYDRAVAALINDIYDRGLDKNVMIMVFGEFGRTPRINKDAGRDHWPGAMSMVMAGGGLRVGQMIGETDALGAYPISKPYTPGCVMSTMYQAMGIDPRHQFFDQNNRPMPILPEGRPIAELL